MYDGWGEKLQEVLQKSQIRTYTSFSTSLSPLCYRSADEQRKISKLNWSGCASFLDSVFIYLRRYDERSKAFRVVLAFSFLSLFISSFCAVIAWPTYISYLCTHARTFYYFFASSQLFWSFRHYIELNQSTVGLVLSSLKIGTTMFIDPTSKSEMG